MFCRVLFMERSSTVGRRSLVLCGGCFYSRSRDAQQHSVTVTFNFTSTSVLCFLRAGVPKKLPLGPVKRSFKLGFFQTINISFVSNQKLTFYLLMNLYLYIYLYIQDGSVRYAGSESVRYWS